MEYNVVNLAAKTVVGLCARTKNNDPECGAVIGSLWAKLFENGVYHAIPHKANEHTVGLYSDYESDMMGPYDVTIGCEVTDGAGAPEGTKVKHIPAGKYAEFVVHGDVQVAVGQFWTEVWKLPLDRAYTSDFEEYWHTDDHGIAEIHIFLALI